MRTRFILPAILLLMFQACSADPVETRDGESESELKKKKNQSICLASLTEAGKAQLAKKDCKAACFADEAAPDRISCGAMALAHFQSVVDEVAVYAGAFKPAQSPNEWVAQIQTDLSSRITTQADVRVIVNQFLRGVIDDLRGIREGVYYAVGGGESVSIPIEELPLSEDLLNIVYDRPDSFSLKGQWTERELVLLGATANGLLSAIDLIMSQDLNVNVSKVPDLDGIGAWLGFGIQLLEDEKEFLSVDTPAAMVNARDEFHGAVSLLAGREETKENVAQSGPGFLAIINASFEKQVTGASAYDSPNVLKLTDVDGDAELSKGDSMLVVLKVNGEEVPIAFPYIFSATFTKEIFTLLSDINTNMDGNKIPVHLAPLYNSFVREQGIFSAASPLPDTMPDVIALDFNTFFAEFKGARHLLPYWYEDHATRATETVNKLYFENVSAPVTTYFFAYERELGVDASHFDWAVANPARINWFGFTPPGGFGVDGLVPITGHYVLFQDPDFAGLLNVNTTPFENNSFHLNSSITTGGEFIPSKNNQMTNALLNAMLVWAAQ